MTEVRLSAVGHAAVTGRHDKTLELTAEDGITARATCVLGVAAGPLPGELPALRGLVALTLAAGGIAAVVHGEVNPGYASADRLVVRRSDRLDPDTFLVNASAAAADLPPELLAALRSPGAPVEVTAAEVGTPAPVLLVLLPGEAPAGIARLAAQADLVVDLTGRGAPAPAVPLTAPRRHGVPGDLSGRRTVVVLAESLEQVPPMVAALPGARVLLWPPAPGADLLLAAGQAPTPALLAGALPAAPAGRRDLGRRIAATGVPAILTVPIAHLPPAAIPAAAGAPRTPTATTSLPRPPEQNASHHDATTGHDPGDTPTTGAGITPADTTSLPHPPEQSASHHDATTGHDPGGTPTAGAGITPAGTTSLPHPPEQSASHHDATTGHDPGDTPTAGAGITPAGTTSLPHPPEQSASHHEGSARAGGAVGDVAAELAGWRLVVPDPAVGWGVGARVVRPGEPVDLRGSRRAPVVAFVPPADERRLSVEPGQLARWLRDAGATGRDTAAVLTGLGVPRREAYRLAAGQG